MTDDRPRRSGTSIIPTLLALALAGLCLRNVFTDDTLALASKAACDGRPGCSAQMSKGLRTPIGHSYHFMVAGNEVEIDCRRAYVLEGEYACKDKAHGWVASLSASASASGSASSSAPAPASSAPAPKPRK